MTVVQVRPARLLTVGQVAARLSVSRSTVYRLLQQRELTQLHVLGGTRVLTRDVDRYIRKIERQARMSTGVPGHPNRRQRRRRVGSSESTLDSAAQA